MQIDETRYNIETIKKFEQFIYGHDDEQYIVHIEYDAKNNDIYKFKQDPELGLIHEKVKLKSFLWMKNLEAIAKQKSFYRNNRITLQKAMDDYGITIKKLTVNNNRRTVFGYKYLLECELGHNKMLEFFRKGGINIYNEDVKGNFMLIKPIEQYLISTGKRLFKGLETYNDVKRLTFDLETTGLDPHTSRITLIGAKTNFGYEEVIEVDENDPESEIAAIVRLFEIIYEQKPSVITSYNGASFDWPFMDIRCAEYGCDLTLIVKTLHEDYPLKFVSSQFKVGGETEDYMQPVMFGFNIIDINHATKRASAIDSEMENTKLKYLCKYNKVSKSNRVYVEGDKINKILIDTNPYWYDDKTGSYGYMKNKPEVIVYDSIQNDCVIFSDSLSLYQDINQENYQKHKKLFDENIIKPIIEKIKNGNKVFILNPLNDEKLKAIVGTDLFKYMRKVILNLQKYIDGFIQVDGRYIVKRYLMDDLWETHKIDEIYNQASFLIGKLLPVTYQRACVMGNTAMWNQLMFAFSYENDLAIPLKEDKHDILGGLSRLVKVGFCKNIMKCDFSSLYPSLELLLDLFPDVDILGILKAALKFFHTERFAAKNLMKKYKKEGNYELSSKYDRKQLPIKILINAFFGGMSSWQFFHWADTKKGEFTTAGGRQFLRLMNKYFIKHGYDPILMDTDGVNFVVPDSAKDYFYIGKGQNYLVDKDKEYKGAEAHIAEFNDLYMRGEMGLALEKTWPAGINFARKNYALLNNDGTIAKTGNSIKSRGMATYVKEFIDDGLLLLLQDKGYEFIQLYYKYIEDIYNRKMPVTKLATKGKVKQSVASYNKRGKTIKGVDKAKQAHMELIISNNLQVNVGDAIYYINVGTTPSHGDSGFNKKTNQPYAVYIPTEDIESGKDINVEYNIKKYIKAFNTKVESLLTVFDKSVRDKIIIDSPDKKVNWLISELKLVNGQPLDEEDQDSLHDIFSPEPAEVEFWKKYDYNPDIWHNENVEFTLPRLNEVMFV
jgi:DNA polymerase elongation subunit (family B)